MRFSRVESRLECVRSVVGCNGVSRENCQLANNSCAFRITCLCRDVFCCADRKNGRFGEVREGDSRRGCDGDGGLNPEGIPCISTCNPG